MKRLSAVIVLIAAFGAHSLQAQQTIDEIAARVNGDIILKSDIEKKRKDLLKELASSELKGAEYDRALAEETKNLLRDLIDKALLLQIAKEQGLNASADVVKIMESMRQKYKATLLEQYKSDNLDALEKLIKSQGDDPQDFREFLRDRELTRQVIQHEVYSRVVITSEETRNYYDTHTSDFDRPAGVQLSVVVVSTKGKTPDQQATQRNRIDAALAALKKGDKFSDVAQEYSEDASATDGGSLGFVEQKDLEGGLDAEVSQAIAKLNKGEFSDIIVLADRLMIVKLDDRHNGGILPYELAQNDAWQALMSQRTPDKTREFLNKLRSQGFIKVADGYTDSGALRDSAASVPPKAGKN
jgi:parvulin-like peptidyl-prolyl isomerase